MPKATNFYTASEFLDYNIISDVLNQKGFSMQSKILGGVFDIYFFGKNSAENIISIVMQNTVFKKLHKLPTLNIPEIIRQNEEQFKHSPLYEIYSEDEDCKYKVNVGDGILGITAIGGYESWGQYFQQIQNVYQVVLDTEVCEDIERMGLRHIRFLENYNIFTQKKIKNLLVQPEDKHYWKIEGKIKEKDNIFTCHKNLTNKEEFENAQGSIIDIIVAYEKNNSQTIKKDASFFEHIQDMHKIINEQESSVLEENIENANV